jgi:cysteine desulfurase
LPRFSDEERAAFGNQVVVNGHPAPRLPNTLNVSFVEFVDADLLARMPDVAAPTSSGCHTSQITFSPVLKSMGIACEVGLGAIRFNLGPNTTPEEIEEVASRLTRMLG